MNKLIPLLAFSILLLVPIGVQNAFANHTPPGIGTTGHCDIVANPPMPGVDYSNCDLTGVDFSFADLSNAILSGANLSNANLIFANLIGADLSGANLSNANLSGANLSFANLSNVILFDANLFGADLSGAILDCFGNPICNVQPFQCGAGTIPQNNQCIPDPNQQPIICGQNTNEVLGVCVPVLNQICGQGTIISGLQCIAQSMSSLVGGTLLEINTVSLLVDAIGTNSIITGLVGITLAGVAGQAVWFVHRRKKNQRK